MVGLDGESDHIALPGFTFILFESPRWSPVSDTFLIHCSGKLMMFAVDQGKLKPAPLSIPQEDGSLISGAAWRLDRQVGYLQIDPALATGQGWPFHPLPQVISPFSFFHLR